MAYQRRVRMELPKIAPISSIYEYKSRYTAPPMRDNYRAVQELPEWISLYRMRLDAQRWQVIYFEPFHETEDGLTIGKDGSAPAVSKGLSDRPVTTTCLPFVGVVEKLGWGRFEEGGELFNKLVVRPFVLGNREREEAKWALLNDESLIDLVWDNTTKSFNMITHTRDNFVPAARARFHFFGACATSFTAYPGTWDRSQGEPLEDKVFPVWMDRLEFIYRSFQSSNAMPMMIATEALYDNAVRIDRLLQEKVDSFHESRTSRSTNERQRELSRDVRALKGMYEREIRQIRRNLDEMHDITMGIRNRVT